MTTTIESITGTSEAQREARERLWQENRVGGRVLVETTDGRRHLRPHRKPTYTTDRPTWYVRTNKRGTRREWLTHFRRTEIHGAVVFVFLNREGA